MGGGGGMRIRKGGEEEESKKGKPRIEKRLAVLCALGGASLLGARHFLRGPGQHSSRICGQC